MQTAQRNMATQQPTGNQTLFKVGAISGIVGGLLGLVANALHPRLSPDNLGNPEKLLDLVARTKHWTIDHLAIEFALVFGLIALVAIARSITGGGETWARFALYAAVASGAVGFVSFSVDGMVLGGLGKEWGQASGAAKEVILERLVLVNLLDHAFFAVATIGFFGVTPLLYGMAFQGSDDYPSWVGVTALLGGVAGVLSGAWMWMAGDLNVGNFLVLFTITSVLFGIWTLAASIILLRRSKA